MAINGVIFVWWAKIIALKILGDNDFKKGWKIKFLAGKFKSIDDFTWDALNSDLQKISKFFSLEKKHS